MSKPDYKEMFGAATMKNEDGFVLITVVMVMLLLMGLVLAAANSSLLEILISKNNQEYTARFYQAESAAQEIVDKLNTQQDSYELTPEDMDKTTAGAWIQDPTDKNSDDLSTLADVASMLNAPGSTNPGDPPAPFFNPPSTNTNALKNILGATADIRSVAIYRGTVGGDKGSTLNMGSSSGNSGKVYQYEIFGQASSQKTSSGAAPSTLVSIGYKKRVVQ